MRLNSVSGVSFKSQMLVMFPKGNEEETKKAIEEVNGAFYERSIFASDQIVYKTTTPGDSSLDATVEKKLVPSVHQDFNMSTCVVEQNFDPTSNSKCLLVATENDADYLDRLDRARPSLKTNFKEAELALKEKHDRGLMNDLIEFYLKAQKALKANQDRLTTLVSHCWSERMNSSELLALAKENAFDFKHLRISAKV